MLSAEKGARNDTPLLAALVALLAWGGCTSPSDDAADLADEIDRIESQFAAAEHAELPPLCEDYGVLCQHGLALCAGDTTASQTVASVCDGLAERCAVTRARYCAGAVLQPDAGVAAPDVAAVPTTADTGLPSDIGASEPSDESDAATQPEIPAPPSNDPTRPWASNTGPSAPEKLTSSPSLRLTTAGAVIENVDIVGGVTIEADNVTLRNFRIEATSHYGIRIASGHRGIVIEDGEIHQMSSAAILGVGFTARRLYVHDSSGDGFKVQGSGGPTLVEYCFVEKLGRGDGAHADGNQTRGGSNITFRYNNIYMPSPGTPNYPGSPYKSNATFMLQLEISNFVIERNWLTGGNYTIYGTSGVSVRNNIFGRENGGYPSGKEALRLRSGSFAEWSGNVWENGDPI
jgi:hypothetical protein